MGGMTRMARLPGPLLPAALLVLVAACSQPEDRRVAFDGVYFKARTANLGDDRASFTATVSGVSASLAGAREAGRYEGTKYCIANYGTSRINWTVGPETEQPAIVDDTITFQGRCAP